MKFCLQIQTIYARRGLKRAAVFAWGITRAGQAAEDWLDFIARDLQGISENLRLNLMQKPFRPYLRRWFNPAQRAEILRYHYTLLNQKIAAGNISTLLTQPGIHLARLTGKSGATYSIYLGNSTTKEGDMDIFYTDDRTGAFLATITGTFAPDGVYIGGLRGVKPPLGKAEIVFATRDLHGLRPKHAALYAACAIADWFGALALIAPTRRNHITWRFGMASREILADYDAFWREFSEERSSDGDYILPVVLPRRDAADVKSKKRGEWLKRQTHLDEMSSQIANNLNRLKKY